MIFTQYWEEEIFVEPGFEPWAAGWEAQSFPLPPPHHLNDFVRVEVDVHEISFLTMDLDGDLFADQPGQQRSVGPSEESHGPATGPEQERGPDVTWKKKPIFKLCPSLGSFSLLLVSFATKYHANMNK